MSDPRLKMTEKGFTLVEMMVVLVIIGILVTIAVPVYNSVTTKANRAAVEANLRTIDGAINSYRTDNEKITATKALLMGETEYLQVWPIGPDGVEYDISDDGKRAIISSKEDAGAWFTTEDVSLPLDW